MRKVAGERDARIEARYTTARTPPHSTRAGQSPHGPKCLFSSCVPTHGRDIRVSPCSSLFRQLPVPCGGNRLRYNARRPRHSARASFLRGTNLYAAVMSAASTEPRDAGSALRGTTRCRASGCLCLVLGQSSKVCTGCSLAVSSTVSTPQDPSRARTPSLRHCAYPGREISTVYVPERS